jgi:carbamoyl-phosphate synthase L subunit-like protein
MKPKVLIATTCRWFPTARLAMALAKAGCIVEVVCPSRHPVGMTSVAPRTYSYRAFAPLTSFADAIRSTAPELIIPGDDLAVRHLHDLHKREKRKGKAGDLICDLLERSLGPAEHFSLVYQRSRFIEVAGEERVRVPQTGVVNNPTDLKKWIAAIGFPMVLKADGTSGGEGVRVVNTSAEAQTAFRDLQAPPLFARAAKRALIDQDSTLLWPSVLRRKAIVNAQAFIEGHEATSTVACWQGKVLGALHFEVIKKTDSAGPATVVRLIEHADMTAAAERMVRRLNLSGIHGLDFMLEAATGNAYLIEINPRTTQVGHLTLGAERDLPAALNAALTRQTTQPAPKLTENDTIALFPREWARDSKSEFLQSAYHDVPWEEPRLVQACVREARKSTGFNPKWVRRLSARPHGSRVAPVSSRAVSLDCELK